MKWWQDERRAILRLEQRMSAALWVVVALVGAVVGIVHAVARWME